MLNTTLHMVPLLKPLISITLIAFIVYITITTSLKKKISTRVAASSILQSATPDRAHGVIFGKEKGAVFFSPANDEGHTIVFGGSGSGKTSSLLIPTLRSWTGTSLTIDISGDISTNCDMHDKVIFEPSNINTIPYNIFNSIDKITDINEKYESLEQLAYMLMPESERMDDNARFFLTEGRKILTAALIAFYSQGMDFIPICEFIIRNSFQNLFSAIDNSHCEAAIQYINS